MNFIFLPVAFFVSALKTQRICQHLSARYSFVDALYFLLVDRLRVAFY